MNLKIDGEALPIILTEEIACVSPQPENYSLNIHYSTSNNQECDEISMMDSSSSILVLDSDCTNLQTAHGELLDCRVHNKSSAKPSDCSSEKIKTLMSANHFNEPKPKNVISSLFVNKVEEDTFFITPRLITQSELVKLNKKRTRRKQALECFKCHFCPFMTLQKELILMHAMKKDACDRNGSTIRCPGCTNVFYSNFALSVHLTHDHNMLQKHVKKMFKQINAIKIIYVVKDNAPCVNEAFSGSECYETIEEDENQERSSCAVEEHEQQQKRPSCANNKRLTLLETYLDDISNKNDCSLPPRLSSGGDDILENTFNFTAPVSEQLPSIQPENPPAASGLDQEHLIEESSHLHDADLMDRSSDIDEQSQIDLTGQQFIETVSSSSISQPKSSSVSEQESVGNANSEGMKTLDEKLLTETQSLKDQQHFSIVSDNSHFLNINGPFPHQDSFSNEQIVEEFTFATAVVGLDVKNPDSFELTELAKEKTDADSRNKGSKLDCGYRCDISGCKLRMRSEDNIKYHRRCHEGQLYNCPECCKDYSNWLSLSGHLWQAHKIDMELFKCDLCSYRTPSYSRLTSIHRGIHGTAKPFLCDVCGKGFKTIKQMRNHKAIHKDKPTASYGFDCDACGRRFSNRRSLENHVKNLHEKQKPFLCSMCGYSTALKHSLVVHIRKHTGEKPHKCDKCDYQSADHNSLRRHRMSHNRKMKYKCVHCSYSCIQSSSFKQHIKHKHPGLEEKMIFKCEQCNFETLQRGNFLAHSVLHDGPSSVAADDTHPHPTSHYHHYSDMVPGGTIVDLSNAQTLLEDGYYEVNDDSLQAV